METYGQRIYRHHPARRSGQHRTARQSPPVDAQPTHTHHPHQESRAHTPPKQRKRAGQWRCLIWLALAVPGVLWLYAQAPRLFPFATRLGVNPGPLLLAVMALVVLGGLKQAVGVRMLQRSTPLSSDD